jgi:hypothetical protein
MPIRFNCGFCNQFLSIGGSREGTQVHCPLCGGVLTVPLLPPGTFDYSTDPLQSIEEDPAHPGPSTHLRRAPSTDLPAELTDPSFDLPLREEDEFASAGVRKALAWFAASLVVSLLGAGGFVIYLIVATPDNGPHAAAPPKAPEQVAALPAPKADPQASVKPPPAPVEPKAPSDMVKLASNNPPSPVPFEPQPPPAQKLPKQEEPKPEPAKKSPAEEPPPLPAKPKAEEKPAAPKGPPQPPAPKGDPKVPKAEAKPPATEVVKKSPDPAKVEPTTVDPRLAFEAEVQRLSTALREAAPESQEVILDQFRSAKGEVFDRALARAIPDLSDGVRQKAREVLRERMGAEPLKRLRVSLSEVDRELRYAAVRVCRQKRLRSLVPDLIPRLDDPDSAIIWHARKTLEEMTGYDIGPRIGAGAVERAQAVQFWQEWWKKHGTK